MLAREIITTGLLLINILNKAQPNVLLRILGWTSEHHEISMMRINKGGNSSFQPHTEFFLPVKCRKVTPREMPSFPNSLDSKIKREMFNAQKSFVVFKNPTSFCHQN